MPRTRAKTPDALPAGLPGVLREELRMAIDFAEQEAEAGLLDSAALRREAHAEALGPRLAALPASRSEREMRAMAGAILGLRASAEAFRAASDAARARARMDEEPPETKLDAIRRAVAAVERAVERVPAEQEA